MNISYAGEHLSSITDPVGRTTYFTISGGKLTQVDFPDASFKTFDYRPNDGAMISESDKRGNITEYIYNKWDFLEKVLRPDGNEIVMSYGISDTIGNDFIDGSAPKIQNQTNEEGDNEFKDLYTNANGVTTEMYKDMTGYVDKIVQKIDGEDRETLITRDNKGRPTKITRYDGTYAEFKYSDSVSMSLPVCEDLIDGDFSNTECRSREVGDLIYKFDSKTGEEEYFRYNKFGDLLYKSLVVNNEVVEWMSAKYDIEGNLIEQEDANGNKVFKDYYPNTGLLESSKVIVGEQELKNQYFYNDNGNMRLKIAPSGEQTTYTRDDAGNITRKLSARSISTDYFYDKFNRLTQVVTGISSGDEGSSTLYSYDKAGNLIEILDPKNNSTTFAYNSVNQLEKKVTSLGQITLLSYDGNGNVTKEIDPNGNVKVFTYNDEDQLISKVLPDNSYSMDYDDDGNMTFISDSDSQIEFEYEKVRNDYAVKSTKTIYDGMSDYTLSYEYSEKGQRELMRTPHGNFSYGYDNGGRLRSLINHKSENFSFDFDSANRMVKITRPGSFSMNYFDANSFLTGIDHANNSNVAISQFRYTRDAVGNRISMQSNFQKLSYSYDNENQLKTVNRGIASDGDVLVQEEGFDYDSLGNRINDLEGQYKYDQKSQRLTEDYRYFYEYDQNGNLIQKTKKGSLNTFIKYTYSSENQLIKVENYTNGIKEQTVSMKYDALGRRFEKRIDKGVTSKKHNYQFDGQEIISEYINGNLAGVFTHSTLRTDDVLAVDVKDTSLANQKKSYFYLKDGLGSVTGIADSSGELLQQYIYSSFGEIRKIVDKTGSDIKANPVLKTSYTFTNREWDEEIGMYYYRARYYDQSIGRFISEDPHQGSLPIPKTFVSKYSYTGNSPTNYVDPDGRFLITATLLLIGKAAFAGALAGASIAAVSYVVNGSDGDFGEALLQGATVGAGAAVLVALGAPALIKIGLTGKALFAGKVILAGLGGGLAATTANMSFEEGFFQGSLGEVLGMYDAFSNILWGTANAPTIPVPKNKVPSDIDKIIQEGKIDAARGQYSLPQIKPLPPAGPVIMPGGLM
jgi:RHS repeat-associated protein